MCALFRNTLITVVTSCNKNLIGFDYYRRSMMYVTFKFSYNSMIQNRTIGCPPLSINTSFISFVADHYSACCSTCRTPQLFYCSCNFFTSKLLRMKPLILKFHVTFSYENFVFIHL